MNKKQLVTVALMAALGSAACNTTLGESLQQANERAKAKQAQPGQTTGPAPASQPARSDAPVAQAAADKPSTGGRDLVGKIYRNPYEDLAKSFKIGSGISFGAMGKQTLAFDLSSKTERRVLVLKEKGADKWVVTGDYPVSAPAKGLSFVGTAEDDGTGDGPPATVCSTGGKTVQGFGFLKASKKRFDQPDGALAWTVDREGKPSPVTKLVCKY